MELDFADNTYMEGYKEYHSDFFADESMDGTTPLRQIFLSR